MPNNSGIIVNGGIRLSDIVLGTGGAVSSDGLMRLLDKYYDLGGRTVDTARMYDQLGEKSELVVGRWLRTRGVRDSVTVVTKGGFPRERMQYECLRDDIERSLDALGCTPDLYLLHRDDPAVPAGEFADIADGFVRAGYARAWGVSNWDNSRINQAEEYARGHGKSVPAVSQIQWSLAETSGARIGDDTLVCMNGTRRAEYAQSGMPLMAFSSQAKGFFSKYASGTPFSDKVNARFVSDENLARAERVKQLSNQLGVSAAAVALSYILSSGLSAVAVVGCLSEQQLADSMTADGMRLCAEQVKWLEGAE